MKLKILTMLLILVTAIIQGCAQFDDINAGGGEMDTPGSYNTIDENHRLNVDHR